MNGISVDGIVPVLVERVCGGWLALTHPEIELRIGVTGRSQDEAKALFSAAIERWARAAQSERSKH